MDLLAEPLEHHDLLLPLPAEVHVGPLQLPAVDPLLLDALELQLGLQHLLVPEEDARDDLLRQQRVVLLLNLKWQISARGAETTSRTDLDVS